MCVFVNSARIDVDKGWRPCTSEADCNDSKVQVGICHSQ